ncbi:MAG: oxaloacetate-decarboxylating malate dehydrogenase, partial [Thermoplasmata archaeon]
TTAIVGFLNQRYERIGMIFNILKSINSTQQMPILKKTIDISRFNFLRDLHDRNEILFYAFCYANLEKILPIIYTPTVGEAVRRFSRDSARFRGIFLSPNNIDKVEKIFSHFRFKKPTIAVVTDNQGILGIGDQGVGGIDISIGKLSLYVLGAGIRPWETLPLTLDVGTDNSQDLNDPYYLGYKSGRLTGEEYDSFIEKFVKGITKKYPNILIQWEDFSRQNAFTILDRYRYKVLSFNDDIQGTGSVVLAGIINGLKISNEDLKDQRFVIYGAGAAGIGIARRIAACLRSKYNLSESKIYEKIAILDSKGLVTDQRKVANYKKPFSKDKNFFKNWDVEDVSNIKLAEVIKNFNATVLIGTSGQKKHFTNEIIKLMCNNTDRPLIFPLSNPTFNSEATPQEIYKASKGKAIVAAGSPFEPFNYNGKKIIVGQGNNFFIFPGVGLGAILIKESCYINDEVFTEVAITLSNMTPDSNIKKGIIYPNVVDIRKISAAVAHTTIKSISEKQGTEELSLQEIKSKMWKPQYHPIIKKHSNT